MRVEVFICIRISYRPKSFKISAKKIRHLATLNYNHNFLVFMGQNDRLQKMEKKKSTIQHLKQITEDIFTLSPGGALSS